MKSHKKINTICNSTFTCTFVSFNVVRYSTVAWRPMLCKDRETGGYTRDVSGQRLGKHVSVARQQIINNATVVL
jgi:hypothetical protein